jgi:hypothetical protein
MNVLVLLGATLVDGDGVLRVETQLAKLTSSKPIRWWCLPLEASKREWISPSYELDDLVEIARAVFPSADTRLDQTHPNDATSH